jgi:RNA polymerase sigma-70 factor (ECF subfamily)
VPLPDQTSLQLAHCAAQGPTPSEAVIRGELVHQVHEAIGRLSETDREVLIMRMLEGLSNKDVAQQLGLQPAAVSLRLGRALIRLRKVLREDERTE